MSKRTSDSKVKAPLSALAARRLKLQQQAAEAESATATPIDLSPAATPGAQDAAIVVGADVPNGSSLSLSNVTSDQAESSVAPPNPPEDAPIPRQVSNFTPTEENFVYNEETGQATVKLQRGEVYASSSKVVVDLV
ncbi:hypothetical protein ABW19_dt0208260 [Dactylella cylindrospora]|nr:hypothetical protein ABW19_dt0208260 [Dactylella cylindrospora]